MASLVPPGVSVTVCDSDEWIIPQSSLIPMHDTLSEMVRTVLAERIHKVHDEKNHGWVRSITRRALNKMLYDMKKDRYIVDYHIVDIEIAQHFISAEVRFTEKEGQEPTSFRRIVHATEITELPDSKENAFERAMEGV